MATGIVGTINGIGTLTYTPPTDAKVSITVSNSSGSAVNLTINGAVIVFAQGGFNTAQHWVGSNQTLTLTSGSATMSIVVSTLES